MTETPMAWVYKRTESQLWTVGYHAPDGTWEPESDHGQADEAAARCNYLNGGRTNADREADSRQQLLVDALRTVRRECDNTARAEIVLDVIRNFTDQALKSVEGEVPA